MNQKIFCFGELLLRMSPSLQGRWLQDAQMPVYIGGAELNAATALANWGLPVKYCTALPANYLADEIITELKTRQLDLSAIVRTGDRIGTYYLPQGTDLKHAGVIYDRAHSSFSSLQPGMIDWEEVFADCSWFHFSAINPALNENITAVCREALQAARKKGMRISVDLNYRAKLWKYGKEPVSVMPELLQYCEVVMGNIWAAGSLLDITPPIADSKGKNREELIAAAASSMDQLKKNYPQVTAMAYTFRLEKEYWAVLKKENELQASNQHSTAKVIDGIGSGDCFMAGLIHGIYKEKPAIEIIEFAAAAAAGKLGETGDASRQTISDVERIIQQNSKNRAGN